MPTLSSCQVVRLVGAALLGGVALACFAAAPVGGDKDKSSAADKIRKELDQTITLDITEQPLNLALNQIR